MDPLSRLRDLHLPPEPGIWPPAPGWWLLSVLFLLALAVALHYLIRYRRANRYRRAALRETRKVLGSGSCSVEDALQLVRRTALTARHSTPLAVLPGPALVTRLDRFCNGRLTAVLNLENSEEAIARFLYGTSGGEMTSRQSAAVRREIERWIRMHRREDLC